MDLRAALLIAMMIGAPASADFAADEFPPYERCALCHGLFGVSHTAKFPNLGGQKPAYIEAQIRAFLDGSRSNDGGQMAAIVTELKPEEIPVVVEWFSTQDPPEPADPPGDAAGQEAYVALACETCHGAEGSAEVPHLTAQHAGYLEKQMEDFREGRRGGDLGALHANVLQDADLAAISAYLAATPR